MKISIKCLHNLYHFLQMNSKVNTSIMWGKLEISNLATEWWCRGNSIHKTVRQRICRMPSKEVILLTNHVCFCFLKMCLCISTFVHSLFDYYNTSICSDRLKKNSYTKSSTIEFPQPTDDPHYNLITRKIAWISFDFD